MDFVGEAVPRISRMEGAMHVTAKLRALRNRAGYSMEELAKAAGYRGASSIQRYENPQDFKEEYLPPKVARKLAPAFEDRGVPAEEVLALAGLPIVEAEGSTKAVTEEARLEPEHVRIAVAALAEYIHDKSLPMEPDKQGRFVVAFCRWYLKQVDSGAESDDLTVARAKSLMQLLDLGHAQR